MDVGDVAVLTEEVTGLADGADDVCFDEWGALVFADGDDLVMSFVEGGADEVVHSGVDDFEGFGAAFLFVEALGEQNAGVARDVAAGFEEDAEAELLEARDDFGGVLLDGEFVVVLLRPPIGATRLEGGVVDDADTAADGEELDVVGGLELLDEGSDAFDGLDEGGDAAELRSDVHLEAAQIEVGESGGTVVELGDEFEVDAELVFGFSGGDVFVGLRVDVGIHTDGDWGGEAEVFGDLVDQLEFGDGLGVDAVDVVFEGILEFVAGFADAGEGALGAAAAGLEDAVELATGDDVEAAAEFVEEAEDGEVAVGFDGVGDVVVEVAEGCVEAGVMIAEGVGRVDVERRAVLLGQGGEVHVFAVKGSVFVVEGMHELLVLYVRCSRRGGKRKVWEIRARPSFPRFSFQCGGR